MKYFIISLIALLGNCTMLSGQIYMDMAMDTTMSFDEIVDEGESFFDEHGRGQHTGYKAFKRWEYWMKRCLDETGYMISNASSTDEFITYQQGQIEQSEGLVPDWEELGPSQAGNTSGWSSHIGRLSAIGIDDSDENHIIVGSPTGGIWKTTDGGDTWTPIYDHEADLDIYSLAISPHNPQHYYVGTWGAGLRRSIDGGQTWYTTVGLNVGTRIIDIAVSPTDPNIVVVINEGGNVFQSFNGGDRWAIPLLHNGTLYDVEFKPGDGNTVYVSGAGAVFKSEDRGWTFEELEGPWKYSEMTFNPVMIATTAQDPEYLYVLEGDNGGFGALYRSTNGGANFTTQSSNANNDNNLMGYAKGVKGGQAPRDMAIAVNPLDKDEVHVGGIMTHRSLDGGVNWEQTSHWLRDDPLPFIHADIDFIVYKEGRAYFGTDGGLFTSDDGGLTYDDKSTGLGIRQFYRIEISEDGEMLVGGSQDNGTGIYRDTNGWWDFVGADGMEPVIDKDNKDIIYASIQYGNIYKTSNGGLSLEGGFTQTPGFGDWVTPIEQDPIEPNTLYQGKRQLYKTTNGAVNWTAISNFVPKNPDDIYMQEIEISQIDNQFIVVGFEEQVFKTTDGGDTWTDISPDFEFSNVNYISMHPHDKNWIAMTLSGTDNRVVQTYDGGVTWQSLMTGLPDVGAESIKYEGGPKNGLYVSMNPGIYYKSIDYPEWMMVSSNLPNVLIAELEISDCDLYAATYGRGVWLNSVMDNSVMYADNDGDGYGDDSITESYCNAPSSYVSVGGDCNDSDPEINPGAPEICNTVDDNCNDLVDGDDPNSAGSMTWYLDSDEDGYGDTAIFVLSCEPVEGYVSDSNDCNDGDPLINPDAPEVCNGIDDNCDGMLDESNSDIEGATTWYADVDGDSFGNSEFSVSSCAQPSGFVAIAGDCDDTDSLINPESPEICNNRDDDCDALIDGADDDLEGQETYYRDADNDGYGDDNSRITSCILPASHVANNLDCDDTDPEVNPDMPETCNGKDDDCDGLIDVADDISIGMTIWYADTDADGFGDEKVTMSSCEQPDGFVDNASDCDDNNDRVNPGMEEVCNGIDDNCDGMTDDEDDNVLGLYVWFYDSDGDGYGDAKVVLAACDQPEDYVSDSTDCDDNNYDLNPGRTEECDGIDNNCNGIIDEDCEQVEDCDGEYLFIHAAFKDDYSAGTALYSDAIVEGEEALSFSAGESIELIPGFEVKQGHQFEATIKPCFNGVTPLGLNMKTQLENIDMDVNVRLRKGELVQLKIVDVDSGRNVKVAWSKTKINIVTALDDLKSGTYTIYVSSDSMNWNRDFVVIGEN